MINICPNCKGIIPDGMKFCSKCGTDMQAIKEANLPEPMSAVEQESSSPKENKTDDISASTNNMTTDTKASIENTNNSCNQEKEHSDYHFAGIGVFSFILGIVFILFGLIMPIPEKHINTFYKGSSYNEWTGDKYTEYVGGDAYNIMIEASLRGGIIAGRTVAKTVLIVGGSAFIVTGLILFKLKENGKQ